MRRLLPRGFVRGVAVLAGGTAVAQGLTVIIAPLLTRLYLPEELGQLGVYVAFVSIASVAVALRYETAIVATSDRREAAHLTLTAFLIGVPTSLLASGVLYVLTENSIMGFGVLPAYAPLLVFPALFLTNVFMVVRYWFVREETFGEISRALVLRSGGRAVSQVAFGLPLAGWLGLVMGDLVGRILGVGRMLRSAWPTVSRLALPLRTNRIREVMITYRKFPLVLLPSSLIDTLALTIPLPFVVHIYGPVAGGYFALVQRVLYLPASLIGASVADAFHSRVARLAREAPERTQRGFERTGVTLLMIGFVPAAVLLLAAEPIFVVVFGEPWRDAGLLAEAMAPWALAQLVVSPLSRVVLVFNGQERKFIYDVSILLATIGVFVVSMSRGFPLLYAVVLLSLANVAAYGLYYFLIFDLVRRNS